MFIALWFFSKKNKKDFAFTIYTGSKNIVILGKIELYFKRCNFFNNGTVIFLCLYFIFSFIFLMFIFERDRQSSSRGQTDREGDTDSDAGSGLRAVSTEPDAGLKLRDCEITT